MAGLITTGCSSSRARYGWRVDATGRHQTLGIELRQIRSTLTGSRRPLRDPFVSFFVGHRVLAAIGFVAVCGGSRRAAGGRSQDESISRTLWAISPGANGFWMKWTASCSTPVRTTL